MSFQNFNDELNDEQLTAINHPGNVLLIACPGSGKTRTLTYKIADKLQSMCNSKQYVIAITYTHRAADEIHERIENMGIDTRQLWIGTIHAFCLEWIVKPYSIYHPELKNGYTLINSHDTEELLTDLCKGYRRERITYWDCGYYYTPDQRFLSCSEIDKHPFIENILTEYHQQLRADRQIDFELLLKYSYEILKNNSDVCLILGKLFEAILIDEYQDTKEIQYHIISYVLQNADVASECFIVGDPNQSIYQTLGGYPIEQKELERLTKRNFHRLHLQKNYRSSKRIIGYFENFSVYPSKISAFSAHRKYASLITLDRSPNASNLDAEVTRLIKFNIEKKNISPNEICVVGPQWVHLAALTRRLVVNLPEYCFDGPGMFPFSRDLDNFWYKLSRIVLTVPSPTMYLRRLRWAKEIITDMEAVGANIRTVTPQGLLRICNTIKVYENDGLTYLKLFFAKLFIELKIDFAQLNPMPIT